MSEVVQFGNGRDRKFRDRVNTYRQAVIDAGYVVTVTGYGDVALQGRDQDKILLQGLLSAAQVRLAQGDDETMTEFMDRDNVPHLLTPPQVVEMVLMGLAWVSAVYSVSWAIKEEGDPGDDSWKGDVRWPA